MGRRVVDGDDYVANFDSGFHSGTSLYDFSDKNTVVDRCDAFLFGKLGCQFAIHHTQNGALHGTILFYVGHYFGHY